MDKVMLTWSRDPLKRWDEQMTPLSARERRFVNNFVGTLEREATSMWWEINLKRDLQMYRFPHTTMVYHTTKQLASKYLSTGTWTPLPED